MTDIVLRRASRYLVTTLTALLPIALACGPNTDECDSSNHCHLGADGNPECNSGYVWEAPDDPSSYVCVREGGSRTASTTCSDVCVAGTTQCSGGRLRTCERGAAGCFVWNAGVPCSSGACASATACGNCANACSSVAQAQCTSGQLRRCELDGDGCLAWSAYSACPSGACASSAACSSSDPCDTVVCNDPPAGTCLDSQTLESYAAFGGCSAGQCHYAPSLVTCANGCVAGQCVPALSGTIDRTTCHGPAATQGSYDGVTPRTTVGTTAASTDPSTYERYLVLLLQDHPAAAALAGDVWLVAYFQPASGQLNYPDGSVICAFAQVGSDQTLYQLTRTTSTCSLALRTLQLASSAGTCDGLAEGSLVADFGGEVIVGSFQLPVDVSASQLAPSCRPYGASCTSHGECCSQSCSMYIGVCN